MHGFSILVVDDEPEFVSTLVRRLRKRGLDCTGTLDGTAALTALGQRTFAVVLLDMRLPDLDGCAVLREIKKQWPQTQVIILTGHASIRDGEEGLRQGAFDYLIKPAEFETLLEKLSAAIANTPFALSAKDKNTTAVTTT
ncbi:response regulator [Thiovibrio sp. JS02]